MLFDTRVPPVAPLNVISPEFHNLLFIGFDCAAQLLTEYFRGDEGWFQLSDPRGEGLRGGLRQKENRYKINILQGVNSQNGCKKGAVAFLLTTL
jgi:hypothetical protein